MKHPPLVAPAKMVNVEPSEVDKELDERFVLTARSVTATTMLGAGAHATLPAAVLVRAGALFGVSPTAVRSSLSRMVDAGELHTDATGYRLAGSLLEREQRISESQAGERLTWDRTWEIAVVRDEARPIGARRELRAAATALRMAELRDGTWVRPSNLDPTRLPNQRRVVATQCTRFNGALTDSIAPEDLFHLALWANRAERLLERVRNRHLDPKDHCDDLTDSFQLSIATVRHLQTDPLLPVELLSPTWPGRRLRSEYTAYDRRFKKAISAAILGTHGR